MFERLKTWTISDAIQDRSGARRSSSAPPDFRKRLDTDRSNSGRCGPCPRPIKEAQLAKRLVLTLTKKNWRRVIPHFLSSDEANRILDLSSGGGNFSQAEMALKSFQKLLPILPGQKYESPSHMGSHG